MFELKWIDKEGSRGPEPALLIEIAPGSCEPDAPVMRYQASGRVCSRPRCGCNNVRFDFVRINPKAVPDSADSVAFWIDLRQGSVVRTLEIENHPEVAGLAKIVGDRLTQADLTQLRKWFFETKLDLIEQTDVAEIPIDGLPDATGGRMIGFVDVFPFGLAVYFTLDGEIWAVDEQFCVQIDCKCRETILTFAKITDRKGAKMTDQRFAPTIRYDYGSGAFNALGSWPPGNPAPDILVRTLRSERPFWDIELKLHHQILLALYARQSVKQLSAPVDELTRSLNAEAGSRHAPGPSRSLIPKVGRNDPCPCGSGKKFKKCCGRA